MVTFTIGGQPVEFLVDIWYYMSPWASYQPNNGSIGGGGVTGTSKNTNGPLTELLT